METFDGFSEQKEFAGWLEEGVKALFSSDKKIKSACIVAMLEDDSSITAYFRADAQDMAIFSHKIDSDIIMEIIMNNIDIIKSALEGEDEDDI